MSRILLDTNAYSALMAGDEAVFGALADAECVYMSVIVLGELHAGFRGGRKANVNLARLSEFLRKPTVKTLSLTPETAEIFGEVKHALKTAGTPIPINDVWISAHALQTGARVVTFDKHFTMVAGLRTWEP